MCNSRTSAADLDYEFENETYDIPVPATQNNLEPMKNRLLVMVLPECVRIRRLASNDADRMRRRTVEPHLVLNNRMIMSQKVCRRP